MRADLVLKWLCESIVYHGIIIRLVNPIFENGATLDYRYDF